MALEKYSIGIGDRFGREGQAQLRALETARRRGASITPVWNKSNREHKIIGTTPEARSEAWPAERTDVRGGDRQADRRAEGDTD